MVEKFFEVEEPGELGRFGYSLKDSAEARRRALIKAVESDRNSGLEVYHKLLGLANVTHSSQPENSKKYRADSEFVKKRFISTKYW